MAHTEATLVSHGELAELLSVVHSCGCLSTPDYGYLPCPSCHEAASAPTPGDVIDAQFFALSPELILDSEGEEVFFPGDECLEWEPR